MSQICKTFKKKCVAFADACGWLSGVDAGIIKRYKHGKDESMAIKIGSLVFEEKPIGRHDTKFSAHTGLGTFTVLDRLTGSGNLRDTETGYRDTTGKFWSVTGMFDIREYPELTLTQAVEEIKAKANLCQGD